jgi:hypothetical protein
MVRSLRALAAIPLALALALAAAVASCSYDFEAVVPTIGLDPPPAAQLEPSMDTGGDVEPAFSAALVEYSRALRQVKDADVSAQPDELARAVARLHEAIAVVPRPADLPPGPAIPEMSSGVAGEAVEPALRAAAAELQRLAKGAYPDVIEVRARAATFERAAVRLGTTSDVAARGKAVRAALKEAERALTAIYVALAD